MSIYDVLAFNIPIIAYSVIHQPKNAIAPKEYTKALHDLRIALNEETNKIQSVWQNHLAELTTKTVQTSRGNLSQFLSTPLQSDTSEIHKIIRDQVDQTAEQLLPKINYGLFGGYDSRFITDINHAEMPRTRTSKGRSSLQKLGFKLTKSSNSVYESLYFVQGGSNLDVLEYMVRIGIGIYNSPHGIKSNKSGLMISMLYNLLFQDGSLHSETDKFEFQVNFEKGKEHYSEFNNAIEEEIKVFRTEIHDLNVSVWQRKLGLGVGGEYILRIRTKDKTTLRTVINVFQKFIHEKNIFASALGAGIWQVKEIV